MVWDDFVDKNIPFFIFVVNNVPHYLLIVAVAMDEDAETSMRRINRFKMERNVLNIVTLVHNNVNILFGKCNIQLYFTSL